MIDDPQVQRTRPSPNHGWLDSFHTFSFADYYDPRHMGFGPLRVINEDRVQPGMGFGTHGHRDMEIISYVLDGALEHKDSMGNGSVIVPGDVQRMSAGHRRAAQRVQPVARRDRVHFLQIWIEPARARHPAVVRGEALRRRRRSAAGSPDRLARRARRGGDDPPGRAALRRAGRRRRSASTHALAPGRRGLRPRRARRDRTSTASRSRPATPRSIEGEAGSPPRARPRRRSAAVRPALTALRHCHGDLATALSNRGDGHDDARMQRHPQATR